MPGPWDEDPWADDEEEPGALAPEPAPMPAVASPAGDPWNDDPWTDAPKPAPEAAAVSARDAQPKAEPPASGTSGLKAEPMPENEPAWYEPLLEAGKGAADTVAGWYQGASMGLPSRAMRLIGDATGFTPYQVVGEYLQGAGKRHPFAHAAGTVGGSAMLAAAAPATVPAKAAAAGTAGILSEYDRSEDISRALGAGLTSAAVAVPFAAVTNALTGPAARSTAVRDILTRGGQPEAQAALDRALGGVGSQGTGGAGLRYATQRAQALVPRGAADPEVLQAAANRAANAGLEGLAGARAATPRNFDAYKAALDNLGTDPRGAGMLTSDPRQTLAALEQARQNILRRSPQAADALRQWSADSAIASAASNAPRGFGESVLGRGSMSTRGIVGRALAYGAQRYSGSPGMAAGLQGGTQAGASLAGALGGRYDPIGRLGASKASEQDKAYADAPTLEWTLQSVLSSGQTGLSPEDEQRLTEAVVAGDEQKVFSTDFQLRMRNPAYARRIEEELRSLNGEE